MPRRFWRIRMIFPGIDCVRFGDTEDVILDRETATGLSAIEQVDRAVAMFARYYRYERIEGMERVQTDRIPLEAFREAVANALVHRTWDVRANVQIALYDDRVVVTSPGPLPAGLTTEQYLYGQISVLRNPIVAEVFLKLDYIEKFGTGIARIRRAYRDSLSQPVFDVRGGMVAVTLPVIDAFEGSEEEVQVLKALSGGRILSRGEIEQQTGLSRTRTLTALESLLNRNSIVGGDRTRHEIRARIAQKSKATKQAPSLHRLGACCPLGILAPLQFSFQFGFVFVEVVAHVGDGK